MYIIRKEFTFSAAHRLTNLPSDHPCNRLHGHNYKVEVLLRAENLTRRTEWVRDYNDLHSFKEYLHEEIDHRDLNKVFSTMQTTAENLARRFYGWCKERWPEVYAVRVSETPKTWAEYYED